jgi:predicted lipoprotein with Yx(FWY)xxD motif
MASARVRHILATAAAVGAVLATAACGASPTALPAANQKQLQQQPPAVAAPTGTVPVDDAPANAAAGNALKTAQSGALGTIVVNNEDKAIYRFDKDTNKPPKSNCEAKCAEAWPPVPFTEGMTLEGIDKAMIGSIDRPDGIKQLTVGNWPAYSFAKDVKAGDVTGEAVQGTWWAMAPNGARAKDIGKAAAPGTTVLKAMDVKPFGKVLADAKGFTLYTFDKDTEGTSNCNGECATQWPPVKAEANIVAEGVDKALVGSITRQDGSKQLTVGGKPVYNFAKDTLPCQSNGEGVGNVWFVASPDGTKAKDKI